MQGGEQGGGASAGTATILDCVRGQDVIDLEYCSCHASECLESNRGTKYLGWASETTMQTPSLATSEPAVGNLIISCCNEKSESKYPSTLWGRDSY